MNYYGDSFTLLYFKVLFIGIKENPPRPVRGIALLYCCMAVAL
jgi:hypothetical protein